MADARYILAENRGLVAVTGADARDFLQGLVTNDVARVVADRAIYAALLSPQGRFLHDFFIAEIGDALFLDCESARRADLLRRLGRYRLRSKVDISDASENLGVAVLFGGDALQQAGLAGEPGAARPLGGGIVFTDPRDPALGARAILPRNDAGAVLEAEGFVAGDAADYESLRLGRGVPDGSRDLPVEKALPMENRFEELGALDWDKGCYVGQELTARMKHRALIKKRLVAFAVTGPVPEPGTPVTMDGRDVGEMRSGADGRALALVSVEAADAGIPLAAGDATLTVA